MRVHVSLTDPFPRAAYVHVPFCAHRCGYCDFTVIAGRDDLIDRYLAALRREIETALPRPQSVETLFLGGGTPSYLEASQLRTLLQLLRDWLPLAPGGEYSIECNPDRFTPDRMDVLAEFGINRVSLGVQSFQAEHLRTLERQHSSDDVERVVENLCDREFNNISLDLIYAVPDQSLADWENTLRRALALRPTHLSTYGLTFEKGTGFWTRRAKHELAQSPDELEREMYGLAMDLPREFGLSQYELSNHAAPGRQCRHNQTYWRSDEFLGFGPGAASFRGAVRRVNHRSVTTWLRRVEAGLSSVQSEETLDDDLRAREAVMLGLRQTAGINVAEFESRFGVAPRTLNPDAHLEYLSCGWLEEQAGSLRLTREGRFMADTVAAEFLP